MNFDQFKANVIQWATDRNFFAENGATIEGQIFKGSSEFGELCNNLGKDRDIRDDLGDNMVVAVVLSKMYGVELHQRYVKQKWSKGLVGVKRRIASNISYAWTSLMESDDHAYLTDIIYYCHEFADFMCIPIEDCYETAWNDIKDRKGRMINGVFVKQSDLDKEFGDAV